MAGSLGVRMESSENSQCCYLLKTEWLLSEGCVGHFPVLLLQIQELQLGCGDLPEQCIFFCSPV